MTTTSPPSGGLRERKKRQTRQALVDATLRLCRERGLHQVTVEDIAEAAGVSTRTFFNYFASKEEALTSPEPDQPARVSAALARRPAGEAPLESLRVVLTELAVELTGDRERWRARRELIHSDPRLLASNLAVWGAVERGLVEAVARRTSHDPERDVYPALVVACAVSATRVAVMRWQADGRLPLTRLVEEGFTLLGDGLSPPGPPPGPRGRTA